MTGYMILNLSKLDFIMQLQKKTPIPHDELVELLQSGKIDFLQFVMNGEYAREYLEWSIERNIDPSNDTAELFLEMTEIDMMEHQFMEDEYYGVWV